MFPSLICQQNHFKSLNSFSKDSSFPRFFLTFSFSSTKFTNWPDILRCWCLIQIDLINLQAWESIRLCFEIFWWSENRNAYDCGPMLVTVFDCSHSSVTSICVSGLLVDQLPLCQRFIWKIHRWGMTQSIQNFFWFLGWFVGTSCRGVSNSKTSKLSVNNQQLLIETVL